MAVYFARANSRVEIGMGLSSASPEYRSHELIDKTNWQTVLSVAIALN